MPKFDDAIQQHKDLPEDKQKKAGKAIAGDMDDEHANFLKTLISLLDKGEIKASDKDSMLKHNVYDTLPQEWKDKVDLALINIAEQVRLIEDFYRSKQTPNSSPHLQTMIEQLWLMKQRIEKTHDVFKF
jgi:hypothetical protein